MNIGRLDKMVRIESKQEGARNEYGEAVIAWVEYKTVWASVMDMTSRMQESTQGDLRLLKKPARVMLRYDRDINSTMRIVMLDRDNRVLQIVTSPAEIGNREGLEMMCETYED